MTLRSAAIAAAAQIKAGDNLFFLNKYDAAARIRQQLPYVETVQFRRVLPSKLVVQITECRDPVAIKQDGTVYLLCDKGNIVDTVSHAAGRAGPAAEHAGAAGR